MSVSKDTYSIPLNTLLPDKFNSELLQDLLTTLERRLIDCTNNVEERDGVLSKDQISILGKVGTAIASTDTTLVVDLSLSHFDDSLFPTDITKQYYLVIWDLANKGVISDSYEVEETVGGTTTTVEYSSTLEIVSAKYVSNTGLSYTFQIERGKQETEADAHIAGDYVTFYSPISIKEIVDKTNKLVPLLNPLNTPNEYLQNLADLIGTKLNSVDNTSEEDRRNELIETVNWYKMKGTYKSIKLIESLAKLKFRIFEYYVADETAYDLADFYEAEWFIGVNTSNPPTITAGYLKTPHFGLYIDLAMVYNAGEYIMGSATNTLQEHLWRDSLYDISTNPDFGIKAYVEKTRPVHTVPHYALLLELHTTECGEPTFQYDVNGKLYAATRITGNWEFGDLYFDEPESNDVVFDDDDATDDSNVDVKYFDNDIDAFLNRIQYFKIGNMDENLDSNNPDFDIPNPIYEGTVTKYTYDASQITFYMTVPASENLIVTGTNPSEDIKGATELALYVDSNSEPVISATFPDIYRNNTLDLNIKLIVKRTKNCSAWDKVVISTPDTTNRIFISLKAIESCSGTTEGIAASFMNVDKWLDEVSSTPTIYGYRKEYANSTDTNRYNIRVVINDISIKYKYASISVEVTDSNPFGETYKYAHQSSGYLLNVDDYATQWKHTQNWLHIPSTNPFTSSLIQSWLPNGQTSQYDCTEDNSSIGVNGVVGINVEAPDDVAILTVTGEGITPCDSEAGYKTIDTEYVFNGTFFQAMSYWNSNIDISIDSDSFAVFTEMGNLWQHLDINTGKNYKLTFDCVSDDLNNVFFSIGSLESMCVLDTNVEQVGDTFSYVFTAEGGDLYFYYNPDSSTEFAKISNISLQEIVYNSEYIPASILNTNIELAIVQYANTDNDNIWVYELKNSNVWLYITLRFDDTIDEYLILNYDTSTNYSHWFATMDVKVNASTTQTPSDTDYVSVFTYNNYLTLESTDIDLPSSNPLWLCSDLYRVVAINEKTTCDNTDISEGYIGKFLFPFYECSSQDTSIPSTEGGDGGGGGIISTTTTTTSSTSSTTTSTTTTIPYSSCSYCGDDDMLTTISMSCHDIGLSTTIPTPDPDPNNCIKHTTPTYTFYLTCTGGGYYGDAGCGYSVQCSVCDGVRCWYAVAGFGTQYFLNEGSSPNGSFNVEVLNGGCTITHYIVVG